MAAIIAAAGLIAWLGTGALIPLLRRAALLDRPNERSSHVVPTPRGGGIAVVAAILFAWLALIFGGPVGWRVVGIVLGAVLLAAISWLDDIRGLPPAPRLLVQFAAVVLGMLVAMPGGLVFQGWLPPLVDTIVAALLWIWFVNLFNFMDGIDGIDGSEAAAIGLGLMAFASIGVGRDPSLAMLSAGIAIAAFGFLVWNWSPAKIFMGDVGSIPLGYLLGFLLLSVAARGHWKIALILPLYFLADATITLLYRLSRGARVWQAHREHFYQRATQRGLSHAAVVRQVIAADAVLVGCGWAAENGVGIAALGIAFAVVVILLASLAGAFHRPGQPLPRA